MQSEVKIIHIIVQDQDGQNNNTKNRLKREEERNSYLTPVFRHLHSVERLTWKQRNQELLVTLWLSSAVEAHSTSIGDKSHSVGWRLLIFMFSHLSFYAMQMSTDISQISITLFFSFQPIFLSFHLSTFSFYINKH